MKIKTALLRAALFKCNPAVKTRITLPILASVRVEASNGLLIVTATNLDVWIEGRAECDGELPACCVNFRMLSGVCESQASEELELSLDKSRLKIASNAGSRQCSLNTLKAGEFPDWPTGNSTPIAVNTSDLADGIQSVKWSVIGESACRPNLENVFVQISPKVIDCIGFNGISLAHFSRAVICGTAKARIPALFCPALVSALRESSSVLSMNDNYASVQHANGRTTVKLSELDYSGDWRTIMDKSNTAPSLYVASTLLAMACQYVLLLNDEKSQCLAIEWNGTKLKLASRFQPDSYSESVPSKSDSSGYVQVDAKVLSESLKALDADTIKVSASEGISFYEFGDLKIGIAQLGQTPTERVTSEFQKPEPAHK